MQDDLIERLRDLATKFEGQGGKHYTAALFDECADRIAALEADKARLMGLVKEAGERFESILDRGYICPCIEEERPDHEAVTATLAKIKEPSHDDK